MSVDAEIIVVGSEIVQGRCSEVNSGHISRELAAIGLEPARITILPDDRPVIASEIALAMGRSDIVIVTGGLGSTMDDLTRRAAIDALGGETETRDDITSALEARYRAFGREPPEGYGDHSVVPRGAQPLENRVGTAFGLRVMREGRELFLLPGVPSEMKEMLRASVLPSLAGRGEGAALLLRTSGLTEVEVEERLRSVLEADRLEAVSIVSGISGVDCYLRPGAWDDRIKKVLVDLFGTTLYSTGPESLEEVCLGALGRRRSTISTAESVTGGLIASRIVDVPGASAFFLEGFITYSDRSKVDRLGVTAGALERHGAVSSEVCAEMAEGVRERTGSDIGLSTTGIAGPDGATEEKPVGLCFIGLSDGRVTYCTRRVFPGDRNTIRSRAASAALDLLRLALRDERGALRPFVVSKRKRGRRGE
jgi:nicotinamide-nucleotide amidase